MTAIITGAGGTVAYWTSAPTEISNKAFGSKGDFRKPQQTSFAKLSAFADNSNHAPAGLEGEIDWDIGVDFLFRIAGAR
jgi:hypothetical protein